MMQRRRFIWTMGRGALAVGVLGLAACGDDSPAGTTVRVTSTSAGAGAPDTTAAGATMTTAAGTSATTVAGDLIWARASFVFVSAYVLVRGGRATLVDTGVAQSESTLDEALAGLDLGWDAVDHVVLTHHHGDHVGGLGAAADRAAQATLYAGEPDIASIDSPRPLAAVGDGDQVMGLVVIETPGHTAGSISLLDEESGVLVVGDALTGGDDGSSVSGSNPEFTADAAQAAASVGKLAGYPFETILFGHGEPVLADGAALLQAYAASLTGY